MQKSQNVPGLVEFRTFYDALAALYHCTMVERLYQKRTRCDIYVQRGLDGATRILEL
jgi:hypothetical protein